MDGIVPILFLMIAVTCFISVLSGFVIGAITFFAPGKIGKKSVFFASLNLIIVGIANAIMLSSIDTIIGYSPFVFVTPLLFIISGYIWVQCMKPYKHNKSKQTDAQNARAVV